jgi:hypothetical protein
MMLDIKKTDWKHVAPTKKGIAILFWEQLQRISGTRHQLTHEQVYEQIEEAHIRDYGEKLPFASFESFRKWFNSHNKEIYRKP